MTDNPIFKTITDVLGLGRPPQSFREKISGLERMFGDSLYRNYDWDNPQFRYPHYTAYTRADKGFSLTEGAIEAKGPQTGFLFRKLRDAGMVPAEAENVFSAVGRIGGSLIYNESKNSLFYSTGSSLTPLPISVGPGLIGLNNNVRKVNNLLYNNSITSFGSAFYGAVNPIDLADSTGLHKALRLALKTNVGGTRPLSSLLMGGVTSRGMYTPEEGFWTGSRLLMSDAYLNSDFKLAWEGYRNANSAFSMLLKTSGRSIYDKLSPDKLDYSQAFDLINKNKDQYFSQLTSMLVNSGTINTIPFIKPEYLGAKSKFLVGDPRLTELYGSKFEKHSITKGLYQLAKIRSTTASQFENALLVGDSPYAPYLTRSFSGDAAARRELGFNVAVVDTTNDAFSKLYFQEGGGMLTAKGAKKLAFDAPVGSIKIKSPTIEDIDIINNLFNINLASGNKLTGLSSKIFDRSDYIAALKTKEGLGFHADIKRFTRMSGGKYKGVIGQLVREGAFLSKAELTDSSLTLDFSTGHAVTPTSVETVLGGRRFTNQRIEHSSLKGILPSSVLNKVDIVISADEFAKTFGPNVYLTNFISKVQERKDAEKIFAETFGNSIRLPAGIKPTGMIIPLIKDHDSAFVAAHSKVQEWMKSKDYKELAEQIEHGTSVISDGFAKAGIAGVRMFGMSGGLRTDFMMDINMMSPTKITPSKMITLARGSRLFGYNLKNRDPVFELIKGSSIPWKYGDIGIDALSGELALGKNHILRQFSQALLGNPGTIHPGQVVSFREGKFYQGNEALKPIPSMSMFSHREGGVPLSELSNTILGNSADMVYIDLGAPRKLNLLGMPGAEREYQYLPVPLKYMRLNKGAHDRAVVGKKHPAYQVLNSLVSMQNNEIFDGSSPIDYTNLLKAVAGKKGLLNRTSTVLFNMGTRARLVAQSGEYYTPSSLTDVSQVFNDFISQADFNDWVTRKSGISSFTKEQAKYIRKQVKNEGFFYALVNADPAQRAEHFLVKRITVDPTKSKGNRLGQMNISMHPLSFRMYERDVDRDAITMTPLTGLNGARGRGFNNLMEDRIKRQEKAIAPFMWYYNYEMRASKTALSSSRFSGIQSLIEPVQKYIRDYIGSPKSIGYSITRASDSIMNEIVAYGVEGARNMGILGGSVSEGMISSIIKPYTEDAQRLPVVQALLQNLYQGGVQKGQSKAGLEELAEGLVRIGQRYKGASFNREASIQEATDLVRSFLSDKSNKIRAIAAMDYMVSKNIGGLDSKTADLIKADLESELTSSLSLEATERLAKYRGSIIDAQAELLGEYLGTAIPLSASIRRAPKTIAGIIQKNVSSRTSKEEIYDSVVEAAAGESVPYVNKTLGPREFEKLESAVNKSKMWSSIKEYFKEGKGKFGIGLGVGAVAGATIVSSFSGPKPPPMPREINDNQPTDVGPEVFQRPPKLYGSNQVFAASKMRSPETFSPVGGYNFSLRDNSNVTIKDKRSPYSSYLIDKEIRNTAKSDYSY